MKVRRWATLLLLFVVQLPALPAQAHAYEESTDPVRNARLAVAPASVRVRFLSDIEATGLAMVVRASDGTTVSVGPPAIEQRSVHIALRSGLADDTYQVSYRVLSADGATMVSSFRFTVGTGESGVDLRRYIVWEILVEVLMAAALLWLFLRWRRRRA